jgi:hypothetical protein
MMASYITENAGRTGKCGRLGNYMNFGFSLSVKNREGETFDINQDQYYSDAEVIITNPPEMSRTYSSICCGSSAGGSHGRSMLDSPVAWVSGNPGSAGEWMQIDLGSILLVHGVVIQARADFPDQWVTEIEVQCSTTASNFVTATATGGGTRFFPTSTYSNQIKSQQRFNQPVGARYIKIIVHASAMPNFHGLAMRAGVLTSSFNQGNRLDATWVPPLPHDWTWSGTWWTSPSVPYPLGIEQYCPPRPPPPLSRLKSTMTTVQLAHHTQCQEVYHTVTGNAFDELSGIGKDGAVSRPEICVVMPKSNPHTGPCYGDIGLPLTVAKIKGRTGSWLLGLSHSDHCSMHLGLPAVFTRVSSSLQWIRATVPLLGAYPEQFTMTLDILQLGLPDGAYLTVHSGTNFKEEILVDDGLLDSKCQVRWGTHM